MSNNNNQQNQHVRGQLQAKYLAFVKELPEVPAAKRNALGFSNTGQPSGLVSVGVRANANEALATIDSKLEWNEKIEPEDFLRRGARLPVALFERPNNSKEVSAFQNLDDIFRFFHQRDSGFIRNAPDGGNAQQPGSQFDLSLLEVPVPVTNNDNEYDSILGRLRSQVRGQSSETTKPWQDRSQARPPVWERIFSGDIWANRLGQMMTLFYAIEDSKTKLPMKMEILADRVEAYSKRGDDVWSVLRTYRTLTVEDLLTRVSVEGQRLTPDEHGRCPLEYKAVWEHIDEIMARMPADQQFTRHQLVEQELGRHYFDPIFLEEVEQPGGTLMRKAFEMGHIDDFFKLANRSGKLLERIEVDDIMKAKTTTETEPLIEIAFKNEQLESVMKAANWRLNPRAPFELFKGLPDRLKKDAKFDPEKAPAAHMVNFASALQASRSDSSTPTWVSGRK